jgi:hypothetical protein
MTPQRHLRNQRVPPDMASAASQHGFPSQLTSKPNQQTRKKTSVPHLFADEGWRQQLQSVNLFDVASHLNQLLRYAFPS